MAWAVLVCQCGCLAIPREQVSYSFHAFFIQFFHAFWGAESVFIRTYMNNTNTKPTASAKEQIFSYLEYLKAKNGPDKADYDEYDKIIQQIATEYQNKKVTKSEIKKINSTFNSDFLNETLHGHVLTKPLGYPGDFIVIDKIYTYHATDKPELKKWDKFFHQQAAPKAVRNRKTYFKKLLTEKAKKVKTLSVLNLASGSGRDMFEFYQTIGSKHVITTCVEMDKRAIEYAKELNKAYLQDITFINKNIFRFKTDRQYDVIWSAGLFDYFDDKKFVFLLKALKNNVKQGGEIIIGNFSTYNPSRAYMEIFGEWFLEHRSEKQLIELAEKAGFPKNRISVGQEPEKVNLFLHIQN